MIVQAEKIFAIGDIHGCLDKLKTLLGMIRINWNRHRMSMPGP